MDRQLLELIYARINDLECRCNPIEESKLFTLYRLADRVLSGGQLTEAEIKAYILNKYKNELKNQDR